MKIKCSVLAVLLATCFSSAYAGKATFNNFVTEYVSAPIYVPLGSSNPEAPVKTVPFESFRDGWVFISFRANTAGVRITLDSNDPADAILTGGRASSKPLETMRYVKKGPHTVCLFLPKSGNGVGQRLGKLIVRSIPEIMVANFRFVPSSLDAQDYYWKHSWDFIKKNLAQNVNVAEFDQHGNAAATREFERYRRQWQEMGKKALDRANIPGTDISSDPYESDPDKLYNAWGRPLEKMPYIDGIAIDEFSDGAQSKYPAFAAAFDKIAANPKLKNKKVYSFITGIKPQEMRPMVEVMERNNYKWLHEGYLPLGNEPGKPVVVSEYKDFIKNWSSNYFAPFKQAYPYFIPKHMMWTFAMYNYHWSFDLTPELDFKVFLDMQFHHLANSPVFENLYGVCLYTLASTTEEQVRYTSALVRHYCIEGNKEMFNSDPLALGLIKNPGFEEGTADWQTEPAEDSSIQVIDTASLPYRNTVGDRAIPNAAKVLCTTRSVSAPNVLRQRITNLKKGRYYSVTALVSDLTDSEKTQILPISINIDGATQIEDRALDNTWTTKFEGRQGGSVQACWNYRFRVFKATGSDATLSLSDWPDKNKPAGEPGHKIIWDFIKVQPYFGGN